MALSVKYVYHCTAPGRTAPPPPPPPAPRPPPPPKGAQRRISRRWHISNPHETKRKDTRPDGLGRRRGGRKGERDGELDGNSRHLYHIAVAGGPAPIEATGSAEGIYYSEGKVCIATVTGRKPRQGPAQAEHPVGDGISILTSPKYRGRPCYLSVCDS